MNKEKKYKEKKEKDNNNNIIVEDNNILQIGNNNTQYNILKDEITLRIKFPVIRDDDITNDINNLFKSKKKTQRKRYHC
jgi:hypothetical protein